VRLPGYNGGDVDLENRLVKLQVTKTDMRYVPLTEKAESTVRSIRPSDPQGEDYVFLPPSSLQSKAVLEVPCLHFKRSFGTARIKAGLEDVHLHDLRHTAASHLLMSGVDIRTLAEILGHKTLQMVHRYTHLLNDHKLRRDRFTPFRQEIAPLKGNIAIILKNRRKCSRSPSIWAKTVKKSQASSTNTPHCVISPAQFLIKKSLETPGQHYRNNLRSKTLH
jgi:hypothetical protein